MDKVKKIIKEQLCEIKTRWEFLKISYTRWKTLKSLSKNSLIGVTYANDKKFDGPGSQLQRIYGIYSVSRLLNLPYIHSALMQIDGINFDTLKEEAVSSHMLSEYNRIFKIPSDMNLPDNYIVREVDMINLNLLRRFQKEAMRRKTFILVRILLPYRISDVYPDCYEIVKKIAPFPTHKSSTLRIAMHVRRGEIPFVAPHRLLSDDYYVHVSQNMCKILKKLNVEYMFEIYTEVALKNVAANHLEQFSFIPNLKIFINSNPIEILQKMATANILIISHSSYSYFAALLNIRGVVLYHKFWHSPLNDWLIINDVGNYSEKNFIKRLKTSLSSSEIRI